MIEFFYSLPRSEFKRFCCGRANKIFFLSMRGVDPSLDRKKIVEDAYIAGFLIQLFTFLSEK